MDQESKGKSQSLDELIKTSTPTIKGKVYPKHRLDRFVKGPIPYDWITKASQLSGTALKVGIVLWYLSGLNKCRTVTLSNRYLEEFGMHRSSKYKALKAMQRRKLVSYTHEKGSSLLVTILDLTSPE